MEQIDTVLELRARLLESDRSEIPLVEPEEDPASIGNTLGKSRTIVRTLFVFLITCHSFLVDICRQKKSASLRNYCLQSAGKVPYLIALVALLGARAIVVKMALGALGQVSPVGFLLTSPHIVDLGDILPLKGLLLGSHGLFWMNHQHSSFFQTAFLSSAKVSLIIKSLANYNSSSHVLGMADLDVPIILLGIPLM
ncbi:hypothetical protein Tco_0890510 [Tanacetum coccineum]|uniref:Uncharacterized protein n=1 Tax=Tanacetum coccineum TaxID=301880 RepID=A0ABQ5C1U5_9ASTR